MRVLVVGGTLFMGLSAVQRLVARGDQVTVFHRGNRCDLVPAQVDHIHGDRLELTNFRSEISAFAPDVVLCMTLEKRQDAQELADGLQDTCRRLIAISSANIYWSYGLLHRWEFSDQPHIGLNTEAGPLREFSIPDDMSHDEKKDVEDVVMSASHLDTTVLRLPAVHGANDPLHRGFEYLWRMDAGRPHIVVNDVFGAWRWSRGYVDNMVDAFTLCMARDDAIGKVFNVCDPVAVTQVEWIQALGRVAGWEGQVIASNLVPASESPDYRHHCAMDSTAIRSQLRYRESVGTEEWIAKTVKWLRTNPPAETPTPALSFEEEDRIAELHYARTGD